LHGSFEKGEPEQNRSRIRLCSCIGLNVVRTRRTFTDFEDYWSTTIAAPNIAPKLATIAPADVSQLKSRVRQQVPIEASGRVAIEARANAIVGRRPI